VLDAQIPLLIKWRHPNGTAVVMPLPTRVDGGLTKGTFSEFAIVTPGLGVLDIASDCDEVVAKNPAPKSLAPDPIPPLPG